MGEIERKRAIWVSIQQFQHETVSRLYPHATVVRNVFLVANQVSVRISLTLIYLPPTELPACVKPNNRLGRHKMTFLYACRYCLFMMTQMMGFMHDDRYSMMQAMMCSAGNRASSSNILVKVIGRQHMTKDRKMARTILVIRHSFRLAFASR